MQSFSTQHKSCFFGLSCLTFGTNARQIFQHILIEFNFLLLRAFMPVCLMCLPLSDSACCALLVRCATRVEFSAGRLHSAACGPAQRDADAPDAGDRGTPRAKRARLVGAAQEAGARERRYVPARFASAVTRSEAQTGFLSTSDICLSCKVAATRCERK